MDVVQIIREVTEVVHVSQGSSEEIIVISPVTQNVVHVIERGLQGPAGTAGSPGPPGADGTSGDLTYTHMQVGASASWVVVHNLGKYPSVSIIDSGGTSVIGDVVYDSVNQLTISFTTAFSGSAYLN